MNLLQIIWKNCIAVVTSWFLFIQLNCLNSVCIMPVRDFILFDYICVVHYGYSVLAYFYCATLRRYAKRGICRYRVSDTLRYCIKMAKCRITQIMPHDSALTLVFWHQSSRWNSKGITPYVVGGDKCKWGGLKLATFDVKHAITRKRCKIDA